MRATTEMKLRRPGASTTCLARSGRISVMKRVLQSFQGGKKCVSLMVVPGLAMRRALAQ